MCISPASELKAATRGLDGSSGVATCTDSQMPSWNVSWGIPLDITGIGNASISGAVSSAKDIKVKIDQTWVESVDTSAFEDALDKMDHSRHAYTDAVNGQSYFLNSTIAVKGLTITFTLTNAVSADVQGEFAAGKTLNIGTTTSPARVKVTVGNGGNTITVSAPDKTYILGRLLKIDKVKLKNKWLTGMFQRSEAMLRRRVPHSSSAHT